jgi:hypothetical protein
MKKILSILVGLALIVGTMVPVYAKTASASKVAKLVESGMKTGIIKSFTSDSIILLDSGKTYKLGFDKNLKVVKMGEEADLMDVAKKGLKVQYKVMLKDGVPTSVTYLDIPGVGNIYVGIPGTSINFEQDLVYTSEVTSTAAVTRNPSGLFDASQSTVAATEKEYTDYVVQTKGSVLFIGAYSIVDNSIKLLIDGKEIKIIKGNFDNTVQGDEAALSFTSLKEAKLTLETPLTTEQQNDLANRVKLTYKVKEFTAKKQDITNLIVNEDVIAELNGKEVSYVKAMYRGNYVEVTANDKMEIVYIDAYYKDLNCILDSIVGNKLKVTVIKNGNNAFTDTLTINSGCTFTDGDGNEISSSSLKKGDKIQISTSEDLNFDVLEIVKTK